MPVSILAQLVMPGIAALVLAYCDGRAAGRPMAALPVGRGALAASKVLVCLAVLALFFGISLGVAAAGLLVGSVGYRTLFVCCAAGMAGLSVIVLRELRRQHAAAPAGSAA